jgi:tetratricopeptide (TPR) repeat protein
LGLAWLSGCAWLPKVTILDDPLSKEEHYALGLTYENDSELELAEREDRLALPLPQARLAMGNLSWQLRGDAKEAMGYYRDALAVDKLPAAANNLAWLILVEGGSLTEAKELAAMAVEEARIRGESERNINNYLSTLGQIEAAIAAGAKARD